MVSPKIISLNGPTDYRYDLLKGAETYYSPVNEDTTGKLSATFFSMTDHCVKDRAKIPSAEMNVHGRSLLVPKATRSIAFFRLNDCVSTY